jgi:hypothetical protein
VQLDGTLACVNCESSFGGGGCAYIASAGGVQLLGGVAVDFCTARGSGGGVYINSTYAALNATGAGNQTRGAPAVRLGGLLSFNAVTNNVYSAAGPPDGGGLFISAPAGACDASGAAALMFTDTSTYRHGGGAFISCGAGVSLPAVDGADTRSGSLATGQPGSGGALYIRADNGTCSFGGPLTVSDSSASGGSGGAAYVACVTATFWGAVTLTDAWADSNGGALAVDAFGTGPATAATFHERVDIIGGVSNAGSGGGLWLRAGGVCTVLGAVTIADAAAPAAGGMGGGAFVECAGGITLQDFSSARTGAGDRGGALYALSSRGPITVGTALVSVSTSSRGDAGGLFISAPASTCSFAAAVDVADASARAGIGAGIFLWCGRVSAAGPLTLVRCAAAVSGALSVSAIPAAAPSPLANGACSFESITVLDSLSTNATGGSSGGATLYCATAIAVSALVAVNTSAASDAGAFSLTTNPAVTAATVAVGLVDIADSTAGTGAGGGLKISSSGACSLLDSISIVRSDAWVGGGAFVSCRTLVAAAPLFFANTTSRDGGGAIKATATDSCLFSSDVTISNASATDAASWGGGAYITCNTSRFSGLFKSASTRAGWGGALFLYNTGAAHTHTLRAITVTDSASVGAGGNGGGGVVVISGASCSFMGPVSITHARTEHGNGGGLYVSCAGTVAMYGAVTLTDTAAAGGGGGMWLRSSSSCIINGITTLNTVATGGANGSSVGGAAFVRCDLGVSFTAPLRITNALADGDGGGLYVTVPAGSISLGEVAAVNTTSVGGVGGAVWLVASAGRCTLGGDVSIHHTRALSGGAIIMGCDSVVGVGDVTVAHAWAAVTSGAVQMITTGACALTGSLMVSDAATAGSAAALYAACAGGVAIGTPGGVSSSIISLRNVTSGRGYALFLQALGPNGAVTVSSPLYAAGATAANNSVAVLMINATRTCDVGGPVVVSDAWAARTPGALRLHCGGDIRMSRLAFSNVTVAGSTGRSLYAMSLWGGVTVDGLLASDVLGVSLYAPAGACAVTGADMSNATSTSAGGALALTCQSVSLSHSAFSSCSSPAMGGAVAILAAGPVSLLNVTAADTAAEAGYGGFVSIQNPTSAVLRNVTAVGTRARFGGAIAVRCGVPPAASTRCRTCRPAAPCCWTALPCATLPRATAAAACLSPPPRPPRPRGAG